MSVQLNIAHHRSAKLIVTLLSSIIIVLLGTFTTRAGRTSMKVSLSTAGPSLTPGKPTPTRVDSALITIGRHGFEPSAFARSKDKFFILVENRSGLRSVHLRLDRVTGNRIHDLVVAREQLDWAELLELTPGEYLLTEADHRDWVCRITITAH